VILEVALACKMGANRVAFGALRDSLGQIDQTNVRGEVQHSPCN
jgi:fructose-1,6-bisphosphatase